MFHSLIRKFYTDNVELNLGSGGKIIATDDIAGVQHELVKVEFGQDGSATQVSAANPLPVTDNAAEVSLASIDSKLTNPLPISGNVNANTGLSQPLTDAQLRATPVPISGTVTPAAQPGVDIGDVTINNAAGAAAVNIQDGGNSITVDGSVTANAGTNLNTSLLALESGGNLAAIAASASVLDDWDESDRAKVNLIVGQSGVDGGSGASSAKTQRVIIATDQSAIPVTFSGSATDNTSLYSNTIVATGAISGLDTTGYQSIVFQFSGVWNGNLLIEGSNDNATWEMLLLMDVNEASVQDAINESGVYTLKCTSKYIRINVQQLTAGSIVALVLGRTVQGIDAVDRLTLAMDRNNNMPLYVEETATKKDVSKALIPSDAPAPIYGFAQAANAIIFQVDTTGYQSVVVQGITIGSGITVQTSNDGITWVSLAGYSSNSTASSSNIANAGIFIFPCLGKFVRGAMAGATFSSVLVFLRQQPISTSLFVSGAPINLQTINGTTPVTAGVNGTFAVGGNVANGVAPTANPLLIAGIDNTASGGLTRRILTDTSGRIINAATDQTNTTRPIGVVSPAASIQNLSSQTVQDTSQFEGQSIVELLAQILLELRINNQMMSELPVVLQGQNGRFDEPSQFRQDQTLFAI